MNRHADYMIKNDIIINMYLFDKMIKLISYAALITHAAPHKDYGLEQSDNSSSSRLSHDPNIANALNKATNSTIAEYHNTFLQALCEFCCVLPSDNTISELNAETIAKKITESANKYYKANLNPEDTRSIEELQYTCLIDQFALRISNQIIAFNPAKPRAVRDLFFISSYNNIIIIKNRKNSEEYFYVLTPVCPDPLLVSDSSTESDQD